MLNHSNCARVAGLVHDSYSVQASIVAALHTRVVSWCCFSERFCTRRTCAARHFHCNPLLLSGSKSPHTHTHTHHAHRCTCTCTHPYTFIRSHSHIVHSRAQAYAHTHTHIHTHAQEPHTHTHKRTQIYAHPPMHIRSNYTTNAQTNISRT